MTAHARQQHPAAESRNESVAELIRQNPPPPDGSPDRHAQCLGDARELFEMVGLVHPGGRQLLPDDTRLLAELHDAGDSGGQPKRPAREPRRSSSPPGLYAVPTPPARAENPPPPKRKPAPRRAKLKPPKVVAPPPEPAPPRPRRRTGPPLKPIAHGTLGGYRAHYRHHELPICTPCNDAYRTWKQARRAHTRAPAEPGARRDAMAALVADLDAQLTQAQQSPDVGVRQASAVALVALMQLRVAMDALARVERRATRTTQGDT